MPEIAVAIRELPVRSSKVNISCRFSARLRSGVFQERALIRGVAAVLTFNGSLASLYGLGTLFLADQMLTRYAMRSLVVTWQKQPGERAAKLKAHASPPGTQPSGKPFVLQEKDAQLPLLRSPEVATAAEAPPQQQAQHQALQHAQERGRSHRLACWLSARAASVERAGFLFFSGPAFSVSICFVLCDSVT